MFFKPPARSQPRDSRGPAALQDIGQHSLMRMVFATTGITLGLFSVLQFVGGNYLFAGLELALTLLLGSLSGGARQVREAELRETLVRLALEEHVIAEGAGALALAAGRRVAGKRKCAVVSGGNIDAMVLAQLLSDIRPRPPRKPRRAGSKRPCASVPPPDMRSSPRSRRPARPRA